MLKRVARFVPFFMISILIGCTNTTVQTNNNVSALANASPVATLLAQAQETDSPAAERLMLKAIRLLRENGKLIEASNILETIDDTGLPPQVQASFIIETAYQALLQQDSELAVSILTTDRMNFINIVNLLDADQTVESSLLRAVSWEESGNYLAAARERIFIASLLPNPEGNEASNELQLVEQEPFALNLSGTQQQNAHQIWLNLTALSVDDLHQLTQNATFDETKGWLQLAWLFRANQDNLDAQIRELDIWQKHYPDHPASARLPQSLAILSQLVNQRPSNIALLLPLDGPYLPAARAIQNGFLAAHFTDTQTQATDQPKPLLTIKVYDSSRPDTFIETYNRAVSEGAELIIGALQKRNVDSLQEYEGGLPIPTIALNRGSNENKTNQNLYQFGLSPNDEARQVATRAYSLEHKNAAVLYPDSAWGERVFDAFSEQWQAMENTASTSATFNNKGDYSGSIKQMLMIQQSKTRANQLKRTLGIPFEFQPRRRQDIDFIFVLASPKQARQIKPLLDFHYAADIPVYGTSHLYGAVPSPSDDRDINGIEFCDMPWLLSTPSDTHANLDKAWPNSSPRYKRFNALGVDAYRLHARIQLLTAVPNARFFGATGVLSLTSNNHITRDLNWAKITKGKPTMIPQVKISPYSKATPETNIYNPKPQGRDDDKQQPKNPNRQPG